MRNLSVLRLTCAALASLAVIGSLLCGAQAWARDDDDDGPDAPGKDQILNRELWERVKGTSYDVALAHIARARQQTPPPPAEVVLPTGWRLSPAGDQVSVGRLPYEAVAFAGKIVVLGNGYYTGDALPEISVYDPATKAVRTVTLPPAASKEERTPSLYPCAVVGQDGDLYVSGGYGKRVYRYNGQMELVATYGVDGYAAGIAPIDAHRLAVLYLEENDDVKATDAAPKVSRQGRLAILDTTAGRAATSVTVGYFPTVVKFAGGRLYVAVQGEDRVAVYNSDLLYQTSIPVGRSPQSLTVDGTDLYVVNASADSVSVVDTTKEKVARTIDLRGDKTDFGGAPTSVAVDGDRLYVTLANLNAVAVVDRKSGRRLGFIPTGWYPTKALAQDGRLYVVSAKGIVPRRPNPTDPATKKNAYVLTLLQGSLGAVDTASIPANLPAWSAAVDANRPLTGIKPGGFPKIKYVFYIVRENRTYDQVLGDLGRGNGDPSLTLFGADITPNAHKIATDFVALDNYYADGEISVLGHSFTTSGYASPLLEWVGNVGYSGRFANYLYGTAPPVTSPAYLWDALDSRHIDYRIYGENYYLYTRANKILSQFYGPDGDLPRKFYAQSMALGSVTDRGNKFYQLASPYYGQAQTPEAARALLKNAEFAGKLSDFLVGDGSLAAALAENGKLRDAFGDFLYHYPFNYRSWDTGFSDLDRAKVWIADFNDQIKRGKLAPFHYLWLPNDHTGGKLTPDQMVAQNDAALARIIEAISHSPVWKDSLVLVTEDDAQAGPDHVDATRTVGLAFGPYVKRGAVVGDRYDQISLIRTIEMALGFPPMNRDDALAVPMYGIFADRPDLTPYVPAAPSSHLTPEDQALYAALGSGGK